MLQWSRDLSIAETLVRKAREARAAQLQWSRDLSIAETPGHLTSCQATGNESINERYSEWRCEDTGIGPGIRHKSSVVKAYE